MKWYLRRNRWRWLPGGLTALAIASFLQLGAFQPLEQMAYQTLFRLRGELPWSDQIVLIAIDDLSLRQLGRFPWSRQYYVPLLNSLAEANADLVIVDLIWSEPSLMDAPLAEAMAQQGRVILAQSWDTTGISLVPVPELEQVALATGHVQKLEDTDGIVRQVELQIQGQPALTVAAAQAYGLVHTPVALPNLDQPLWINWVSAAKRLNQYSFVDVVQGKIPVQAFQNKIVLVGLTATGFDPLSTPFDRNPPTTSVLLHATVLHNLLQQNFLRPLQGVWQWILIGLGGPSFSWLLSILNTRQQWSVTLAMVVGWGLLTLLLFQATYLLPVIFPISLWVMTAIAVTLSERLQEAYLLRQHIARIWTHYCQDVIDYQSELDDSTTRVRSQNRPQLYKSDERVAQLAALAEQLGRSQATQAAIARTLSVGLLAADLDGVVWFCNPVASRWLNVNVGSSLGATLVPLWLSQEQWHASLKSLSVNQSVKHTDIRQNQLWFNIMLQPLVHASMIDEMAIGEMAIANTAPTLLEGFLLLVEDVTDYKQREAELQKAQQMALREATRSAGASRAKSEFLANMSHELRTPLNVILGFTQIMNRDESISHEHQKHLEIINRSGQHLLELINDVLEMSKIEAGRVSLNETRFDLHHLLDDLENMLWVKADAKQLTLVFKRAPDLPQYIKTDEGKLRQVLLNLVENGIKFTNVGGVVLRVRAEQIRDDEQEKTTFQKSHLANVCNTITLYFEVEDSGVGIAVEDLETLFQPFTQTHSGQQSPGGTGLGLTISRKFVQLMGGDIKVQSTIARGSTFKFEICASLTDAVNALSPSQMQVMAIAPNQPTYRILIVEDQWENSQFLVELLTPFGFEVKEARNGQESIVVWESWHPHLILMDLRMPIMNGYEATRQIRARESFLTSQRSWIEEVVVEESESQPYEIAQSKKKEQQTKIIALTASIFEETKIAVETVGCDDFLRKPIQENTLLSKLKEHLGIIYLYQLEQSPTSYSHSSLAPKVDRNLTAEVLHSHLEHLPHEWRVQLYQAAIKGSDRQILQLIEQIPESHLPLTQALTQWLHHFQFDEIINLTQPYLR
jgi:signal transduction histidine kinase/CHASE2 domain-containing sensor protein/DNA-binding response OmpR family regulator